MIMTLQYLWRYITEFQSKSFLLFHNKKQHIYEIKNKITAVIKSLNMLIYMYNELIKSMIDITIGIIIIIEILLEILL